MTVSARDIMGAWVHSHEEDPNDGSLCEVYRPSDWSFGPSRGRRGYEFGEGNLGVTQQIAPADGAPLPTDATWQMEPEDTLVILEQGRVVRRMRVRSVEPDRLVLQDLLDCD